MVFSSVIFLFYFFPITCFIYYLLLFLKNIKFNNIWLLLTSLFFYFWSVYMMKKPHYIFIIIFSIFFNFYIAKYIHKYGKYKKIILAFGISINLLVLFVFKYFNFAIDIFNHIFYTKLDAINLILPIGISFFTFQEISYIVDVYKTDIKPENCITNFALYICLFPQLIAGPIVKYRLIQNEIVNRESSLSSVCSGLERFAIGLSKKVIIANCMALVVDKIWMVGISNQTTLVLWIGSICYTLQIYFDFSGYSDMAIGMGRMFGFSFCENFNMPYLSYNLTEFWRKWHISLSSFFKEYLYIPLGGNKKRVCINLLIVFFLTGLWHGANYTFIIWGIYNGLIIVLEKKLSISIPNDNKILKLICLALTLLIINFGWILFRSKNICDAIEYYRIMLCINSRNTNTIGIEYYFSRYDLFITIVGLIFSSKFAITIKEFFNSNSVLINLVKYLLLVIVFYICILKIITGTYNPFIYYQF